MSLLFLLIALFLSFPSMTAAQHQYDNWFFGERCALSFTDSGVQVKPGIHPFREAGAAISDELTGELLFYTGDERIYNRNHESMENGDQLMGHWSTTQGSLIVRQPGNPFIYYVFTGMHAGYGGRDQGTQYYSVVDMRLANGLGAITRKNVLLQDSVGEKLTAVYDKERCRFWILSHGYVDDKFFAFELSACGLDPVPILSRAGSYHTPDETSDPDRGTDAIGYMVASASGERLALANFGLHRLEVFDFDKQSGTVVFQARLSNVMNAYGLAFSPDASKLYVTGVVGHLSQFDLSTWGKAPLNLREFIVHSYIPVGGSYMAITPGPDGKLYVARAGTKYLGVIQEPNRPGGDCDYIDLAVHVGGEGNKLPEVGSGIDNLVPSYMSGPAPSTKVQTVIPEKLPFDTLGSWTIKIPISLSVGMSGSLTLGTRYDPNRLGIVGIESRSHSIASMNATQIELVQNVNAPTNLVGSLIVNVLDSAEDCVSLQVAVLASCLQGCFEMDGAFKDISICRDCNESILERYMATGQLPTLRIVQDPSTRTAVITSDRDMSFTAVSMYSALGTLIERSDLNIVAETPLSMDVSSYPSGVYYLRFSTPYGAITKRILRY